MHYTFINIRFAYFPPLRFILAAFAFALCCAAAQNVFAATFTVTRNDDRDAICNSGTDCSLREAVSAANAAASDDTINFAAGLSNITLASGDTGDIEIINNGALTIAGPGANVLTIDGGTGNNRIFYTNQAIVAISGVTLQGGNGNGELHPGLGGAIYAFKGTLLLEAVVVQNNGGADIEGGGGIFLNLTTNSGIINSTFSGNNANQCGAFNNVSGTLIVLNTTISGNSAGFNGNAGGGFCNGGGMTLRNSTVTDNSAPAGSGGGVYILGTLFVGNTIIAGNTASAQSEIRNDSAVISEGNNLIGDSANDSTDTFNSITYQTAAGMADILNTPPMLGALQNNGGATPTRALLAGSPAIDKGNNDLAFNILTNTALTTDQRGLARIVDNDGNGTATVDIGAFELQIGVTAANVIVSGRILTARGHGIGRVRVTMTDIDGGTRTATSNAFGYFRFADFPAGETYVFSVKAKSYKFSQPTRLISVLEDVTDLNFVALSR